MASAVNHSVGPKRSTWTHIALAVKDVEASVAWYETYTHLRLLAQAEDKDGKNAWLGDPAQADNPFILVLGQFYEGHDPFAPSAHHPMGPFAHIGVELPSKEAVDEMAAKAKAGGCLALGPMRSGCVRKGPGGMGQGQDAGLTSVERRDIASGLAAAGVRSKLELRASGE